MPMHDWTRVDAGIYHHFHGRWIFAMADGLNLGGLPKGYYALIEYAAAPVDSALSFDIPDTALDGFDADAFAVAKHSTVAVRATADHRKVALVEVLRPGIAGSAAARAAFLDKSVAALKYGLGVLVIDPFPPREQNSNSIPSAIWERVTGDSFTRGGKPLVLASYAPGQQPTVYVDDSVGVGDILPDMPLFLNAERYVNVPLEATYMAAWQTFPADWRNVITGT
jgi:hypothetical protein